MGEQRTLRDLLSTQARRFEKKIFLEYGDQRYSFRAVDDWTDRVATGLNRLGLRPTEKIALLLSNRPEFVFLFLGASKIGMVTVPIDPSLPIAEILFVVQHSDARALVTEGRFVAKIRALMNQLPLVRHWIVLDGEASEGSAFDDLTRGPVLGFWPDLDPDVAAAILYTHPMAETARGVVLTHQNFVSICNQTIPPLRINDTDRFLCVLDLFNVDALVLLLLAPWAAGASSVLRARFSSETILQELSETRITVMEADPQQCTALASLSDVPRYDLSALRLVICRSGFVGAETLQEFEERYEALIVTAYGRVETSGVCCANPYTGIRKPDSAGLPLPGLECRVVDEQGRDEPPGRTGEIIVRGPNVMKGYYKDPTSSAKALRDGWLHTGDLGYLDADGYYYLVDR